MRDVCVAARGAEIPSPDARARFFAAAPFAVDTARLDLSVRIGSLTLANPVMPASGCFGPELGCLIPAGELGAVVTKTVFAGIRGGNRANRLGELSAGMVNSVGIPSAGAAGYLRMLHPAYTALGVPVIISVGGHRTGEYATVVADLRGAGDAYELNVSCPNLERGGVDIGADPEAICEVVRQVRNETDKPIVVKLPSMITSVAECAEAAEESGASALCVANSLPSLPIDLGTGRPALGNLIGGLSGPTIRPVILRLVWLASAAVRIPVIACGGIESADDALEYVSVGATAVQVGTATFARPFAMVQVARDLRTRCEAAGVSRIEDLAERIVQ